MSKNINTNTNIAQIILSDKHEIRLKKKPKKKSSNKKKEALEKVKSALQQYDLAINTAKSKNIAIPEALGKLPDNINQINSISELNALALDLQNRILQINELIQKGSSRATGLFREIAGPQQRGFIPIQQQIQPQIIPNQQIPQQPVQPIQPQQPVSPQRQEDDDAEKTLDQLQKEILSKLDPEDRAKAEAQFEKEKQERESQQPVQPEIPQPEPDTDTDDESPVDSNFEMINGLEGIDGRTINNLKAPIGWATIYSEYRQLIKSLIADIIKIDGDEYNLPKSEDRDIQERQEQLLKEYNAWLNSLNKTQTDYLDTDMTLQTLDNSLIRDLQTPPTELLQRIAKEQGKNINVYSGIASKTEQKESRSLSISAEDFKKQLIKNQSGINNLLKLVSDPKFKNDTDRQLKIYDSGISNLNIFDARLEEQFNSLDGTDKAGILSLYNKTRDGLKVAIREISESKQNYLDSNDIDGFTSHLVIFSMPERYPSIVETEVNGSFQTERSFIFISLINTLKFLGLVSIPIFIFFIPTGIFNLIKSKLFICGIIISINIK